MQPQLDIPQELSLIDSFKDLYKTFGKSSIENLRHVYSDDIVFTDPVHTIQGLNNLSSYFESISENLTECQFIFLDEVVGEHTAFFKWEMIYRHPSIKSNAELKIPGSTYIRFSDKIDIHDDFYDMGAMLYEHLPLIGGAVRLVKSRLKKTD